MSKLHPLNINQVRTKQGEAIREKANSFSYKVKKENSMKILTELIKRVQKKNSSWVGCALLVQGLENNKLLNCEHQGGEVVAQKIMKIELSKWNLKRRKVKRGQLTMSKEGVLLFGWLF